jgi:hypothetical protein
MPDSEWLAQVTAEAFNQGRIELGAAIARLAVQAHRMERAAAVAPVVPVDAHLYEEVNRTGPIFTSGRAAVEVEVLAAGGGAPGAGTGGGTGGAGPDDTPDAATRMAIGAAIEAGECVNGYGAVVPPGSEECAVGEHTHRLMAVPPSGAAPIVPAARCKALTGSDGLRGECHGVLAWDGGEWKHIDPRVVDHAPVPDRAVAQ